MADFDDDDDDPIADRLHESNEPKFIRWEDYGEERWPLRVDVLKSKTKLWVDVRNPLDRPCTVDVNLGCDPILHVALERMRPKAEQLPEKTIAARLGRLSPLRGEYVRVRLTFAPGQTLRIPRSFLPGLRVIRDGNVITGLMPFVEVVGEENPPLHPALYSQNPTLQSHRSQPAPPPAKTQKRRKANA